MAQTIGVNLSPGDWKLRLNKRSPPGADYGKIISFKPALGRFCLYSCGFNRQANLILTAMAQPGPYAGKEFPITLPDSKLRLPQEGCDVLLFAQPSV